MIKYILQYSIITLLIIIVNSCENQEVIKSKEKTISSSNKIDSETIKIENKIYNLIKNDWEEMGLKAKVKLLKQEEFLSVDNSEVLGVRTGVNSFSYKFNADGNKEQEQYLDSLGMIKERSEYYFSESGKKTKKIIKKLNGNLVNNYSYEYNNLNQLSKINITDYENGDKFSYYQTEVYDNNGNEIKTIIKALDGAKIQSAESFFNKNNQKTRLKLYDNMDIPTAICEYTYNQNGDIINEKYYTSNYMLFSEYTISYLYDSKNNWIKKVYSLKKIHMKTIENKDKQTGIQTITFRTIEYY